ncbi:sterol desaturase family protein [Streptomyces sp. NPDC002067]
MPHLPDVVLWSVPAFVLLTAVEVVSYRLRPDEDAAGYEVKDAATSVGMGLGSLVFDALWKIPIVAIYSAVYALTPLRVPVVWWTLLLMLLAQDFLYYWSHRGHHVIRVLWACHVVHHSSRKFNLTTALRQPWTSWTVWPFYLPMIALGVHPAAVAFCSGVNLVYQFWVHTERVGKLPRPVEYVLNTPSHHRVHHASQGGYLDRNFGGILIVWDRMFGSFVPETERPVYGLTKNIATYNPLRVATHEYAAIARDLRTAATWRERAGRVFRGPGWQPAGPAGPGSAGPAPEAAAPVPSARAAASSAPGSPAPVPSVPAPVRSALESSAPAPASVPSAAGRRAG